MTSNQGAAKQLLLAIYMLYDGVRHESIFLLIKSLVNKPLKKVQGMMFVHDSNEKYSYDSSTIS